MTTLTITAANVVPVPGGHTVISRSQDVAGETITPGMPVYRAANDKWMKADNNVDAATAAVEGLSVNSATLNQPLTVVVGLVDLGAILEAGKLYMLSSTAGSIDPVEDLGNQVYSTLIGGAVSASRLNVHPFPLGVQTPAGE